MTISSPENAPVSYVPYGHRVIMPTGLTLGSVDSAGVSWYVERVRGWGGAGSSGSVIQRPRLDGGWRSPASYTPRVLEVQGWLVAPSAGLARDAVDRMMASIPLDVPERVGIWESGLDRYVMARQSDEVQFSWRSTTSVSFNFQLVAPDPRRLGGLALVSSTRLPSSSGGLTLPFTVPFIISASSATGVASLTNAGNAPGPLTMRIDGPVTGPIVTHSQTGNILAFSSSFALLSGEWLDIDCDARTVLANGQSSRAGQIVSRQWPTFLPGINTYSFTAASFSASALLTVTGFSAWA